ncbi:hypothetical protein C8R48DRAFT_676238 [Suillus tomentosus]|nr:hypothetical protein C8R48DRAFT_676238 [Suillus tomentosus]
MDVGPVRMSLNRSEPIIRVAGLKDTHCRHIKHQPRIKGWGICKDASEIEWYHDPDDDMPILPHPESSSKALPPGPRTLDSSKALPPGPRTLDSFVGSHQMPVTVVAGSRHSGRPVKPSAKAREAASSAIPAKCSGTTTMPPATKRLLVSATSSSTIGDNDGGSDDDDDDDGDKDESFVADSGDEEAKEAEEAYQQIKAFGDADRDVRKSLKKDERTADLRLIFTEEKGHKNTHTGESEDGWWCNVCKEANVLTCLPSHREANVPLQNCFFKGSISTRRTHIARNPNCHFPIYKSRCEEKGIIMHERAIPLNVKAFQIVDKGSFCRLLQYLRPSLSDQDIPHRTKTRDEILERAKLAVKRVKEKLAHYTAQEPANAQQTFSATREPTVWRTIPVLEYLQETWERMAGTSTFNVLSASVTSGLDNLAKWYRKTNDTDVYFICLALDPNYKVAYAKAKWVSQDFADGVKRLEDVVSP